MSLFTATVLMPPLVSFVVFVIVGALYTLPFRFRALGGRKLQRRTLPIASTVGKGLAYLGMNSLATVAMSFALWPIYRARLHQGEWPAAWIVIAQLALFVVVDDGLFYVAHRALHTPWLYRRIHGWHHRHHAPYALLGSIMHPAEWLIINGIVVVVPLAVGMHVGVFYLCILLRQWQNAEFHAGVEGWWSLLSKLPGAGGVQHHDLHHERVRGNYAAIFAHWDRWLGTELRARS